jgi:hypothetical protein
LFTFLQVGVYSTLVREDSYPDVAKIFLAKSFEFPDATRDKLEEEPSDEVVEDLRNKSWGSLLVSLADAHLTRLPILHCHFWRPHLVVRVNRAVMTSLCPEFEKPCKRKSPSSLSDESSGTIGGAVFLLAAKLKKN